MKTDARLTAVINEAKGGGVIADVGCDHGKAAYALAQSNAGVKVIAIDVSSPSLEKARRLCEGLPNVECRIGNGVQPLSADEYDTVIIAGMGGDEIIACLNKAVKKFKKYVLVPHTRAEKVRIYLTEEGIGIVKDYTVACKGKFYDIIVAESGAKAEPLSEWELHFGRSGKSSDFDKRACQTLSALRSVRNKGSLSYSTKCRLLEEYTDDSKGDS